MNVIADKSQKKSKIKRIESDEDVKVEWQDKKFDVDYARGEGGIESSSDDEESSSEDEDEGDGSWLEKGTSAFGHDQVT